MKQFKFALIALAIFTLGITSVSAGGDKVRGEEGDGEVVQKCLNFDECPYGTYDPTEYIVTTWTSTNEFSDSLITWGAYNPVFIDVVVRSSEITSLLFPLSGEISQENVEGLDIDSEYDRSIFVEEGLDGHLTLKIYQKI